MLKLLLKLGNRKVKWQILHPTEINSRCLNVLDFNDEEDEYVLFDLDDEKSGSYILSAYRIVFLHPDIYWGWVYSSTISILSGAILSGAKRFLER